MNAVPLLAKRVLLVIAVLGIAAAVSWWWRTFGEVVRFGYLSWSEAGRCLVSENDICSLAQALCLGSHPRNLFAYWSVAFWASAGLFSMGCLLNAPRAARP